MNHILLFENFSDHKYFWPDAGFWLEKLHPEELCFLAICNDVIMLRNSNTVKEKPLFEMISDNSERHTLEPDTYDQDDGIANFEINYEIPCGKESCNIYAEIKAKGEFGPFYPATYMQPSEGGESILNSIDVEFFSYSDSKNDFEALFIDPTYVFKSDIIDKKKLISAIEFAASLRVDSDEDKTDTNPPVIPDKLMEKCESIRKEIPDIVKGSSVLSRFFGEDYGTK